MPHLNFKGKHEIWDLHKKLPRIVLEEISELNSFYDNPDNFLIEGDNLLALKALIPKFKSQVDCIYIDPPYNTGKKDGFWVYNDNVDSSFFNKWLGQHTPINDLDKSDKWLCMMAPRLFLMKELLNEEGIIFISIDHHELHHLICLMNEIFGSENYVEIFSWNKTSTPPSLSKKSRKNVEYILCYEKKINKKRKYNGEELSAIDHPLLNRGNQIKTLKFPKEKVFFNPKYFKDGCLFSGKYSRTILMDDIQIKNGYSLNDFKLKGEFKWSQEFLNNEITHGTKFIIKSKKLSIRFIRSLKNQFKAPTSHFKEKYYSQYLEQFNDGIATNETAKKNLHHLIPDLKFQYPKPLSLIKFLLKIINKKDALILDCFAGSGSTMHAVFDLNFEDKGMRNCILIQSKENSILKPNKNLCKDITRERLEAAIKCYPKKNGYKYYKVDDH